MIRIDTRTVELTRTEQTMSVCFETNLDFGDGITAGAYRALETGKYLGYPVTKEFAEYISDGTLTLDADGEVAPTAVAHISEVAVIEWLAEAGISAL